MSGKRGRPLTYSREVADKVCLRLCEVASLKRVCEEEGMPPESTVRLWALDDVDGFAARYTRARQIGYEGLADETLDIADNSTDANLARLRVDTRKWLLSKVLPKVYGDRIALDHGGKIATGAEDMTDAELLARAAQLTNRIAPHTNGNGKHPNGNGKAHG